MFWTALSAIATIAMALATFITLRQNRKQLDEMKRQWEESKKPIVEPSLVIPPYTLAEASLGIQLKNIGGSDKDPENPYEVKNCYQNWETCKACNIQLVFYRSKKNSDDILVKCLLNGCEASLPVPTTQYPYYKWSDFRSFYQNRINTVPTL